MSSRHAASCSKSTRSSRTRRAASGPRPAAPRSPGSRTQTGTCCQSASTDPQSAPMTAFDDTVRDIGYALRTVRRAPLAAFTIVATVALGLGLVAAVFTVLNALVFRLDAVPDVRQMFAVERPQSVGEPVRFTRTTFEALRRDTSIFSDVYAQLGDVDSRVDGRVI